MNYAAHLDMVGFGSAVLRDFKEAWGALSDLWFAMERVLRSIVIPIPTPTNVESKTLIATGFRLADRLFFEFFSDSIVICTHGDSDDDLFMILSAATMLFGDALRRRVPLRGGVGYGRSNFDPNRKGLIMGESLVNACRAGEHAPWIGIVLQQEIAERSPAVVQLCHFIPWIIPGTEITTVRVVLNWPRVYRSWFQKKPPLSLADWYQPFEGLLGSYDALQSRDQEKWKNTVNFINAQLSSAVQ